MKEETRVWTLRAVLVSHVLEQTLFLSKRARQTLQLLEEELELESELELLELSLSLEFVDFT